MIIKIVKYAGVLLLAVIFLLVLFVFNNLRDRHKGYQVDITIEPSEERVIHAGFSAVAITPDITDTWIDTKGNARYNPREGDTWKDITGSGSFDAVWMSGFQSSKPAKGVHDDLWARAMVFDDGNTRLAWVVLDLLGFFNCDVIDIRKRLPEHLGIDYAIISSTHVHSGPDVMGTWGPQWYRSGVDPDYLEKVKTRSIEAIDLAVQNLRPARFRFAIDKTGARHMIKDTRKPVVVNGALKIMQAVDVEQDTTIGTLVAWDNHAETVWNDNLLISSDFPHFLRDALENGIWHGDSLVTKGLGGTAIFAPGNIGGLMTTHPSVAIRSPFTDTLYQEPSFDKARAQGIKLAKLTMDALAQESVTEMEKGSISLRAKSVILSLDNNLYRLAAAIGILDRGFTGWMKLRSETSYWQMGPASFLHHPGELYPEIADGGIEAPEGQDFDIAPQEIPPLRSLMPDTYRFHIGLSNDMIGYIIPKSQWDENPPHTYGSDRRPYGEINSLGPETAPILHSEMMKLILNK